MNMIPTYMLTVKVSDASGTLYISFPRELGDPIMGMSAKDFQEFKDRARDSGENTYEQVIKNYLKDNVEFKTHHILVKGSADAYSRNPDGEQRFKFYAARVFP
jgi:Replication factor-A C terminal domain